MTKTIYLDAENNVVSKGKAVKYESYITDKNGNVTRVYGVLKQQKIKRHDLSIYKHKN